MEDLGYTKTDKKILMVLEDKVRIIQYDTKNLEVQTLKEKANRVLNDNQ